MGSNICILSQRDIRRKKLGIFGKLQKYYLKAIIETPALLVIARYTKISLKQEKIARPSWLSAHIVGPRTEGSWVQ